MKLQGKLHRFWLWYTEAGYYLPEEKPWYYSTWLNEWFGRRTDFPPMKLWRVYCFFHGHEPIWDHCSKPEHQYCVICRKRTPYALEAK